MRESADAAAFGIANAKRVHEGQIARMAGREKSLLDRLKHPVRFKQSAAGAGNRHGRAIGNGGRGLFG